jgi:type IV pilus assembly protein PilA
MQKGRNQKGFTLVELMVVVVIIGVLVAIAVPVYTNVTTKADRSAVMANLRTIDGAIMTYYATKADSDANLTADAAGVTALATAGYLASTPTGPKTATYAIAGTAPNQHATVSSTADVGGLKLNAHTVASLKTAGW